MSNTDLRLYAGVPLTRDNLNFLDNFIDDTGKLAVFSVYQVKQYSVSPIRRSFESIVVRASIDEVDNVNYMTFKNADGQRYYCYVTNVVYESEDGSRVFFEIDFMTTWINQKVIKDCMIEREHVSNDTIGSHRLDENLNTGDYQTLSASEVAELRDLTYVIGTTKDIDGNKAIGDEYTNLYSGLAFYGGDKNFVNVFLANIVGGTEPIKTIFTMPTNLIYNIAVDGKIDGSNVVNILRNYTKNYANLDGYVPKNNKLFTYPYNFLQISNNQGGAVNYKYENSGNSNMQFTVTGNIAPNPVVTMTPLDYNTTGINYVDSIRLSDYPLCSWQDDIYANWLSQNQVSNAMGLIGGAGALAFGVGSLNPVAIGGGAVTLATSIGNFYQKSVLPNPIMGSTSGGGNVAVDIQTFTVLKKVLKLEYAQMIDGYFTKFGYKVNRIGVPSLKSRPKFNYIKTVECNIQGLIPSHDLQEIRNIFNAGVTFWHTTDIGNYNVVNAP